MYSDIGRPSIPPEQLLRALLLQGLYTIRSERLLMEEIDYSVLFRWFIGLSMDEPIWSPTDFSKNRDRLLQRGRRRQRASSMPCRTGAGRRPMSDEHFTVDGTMLEAWASLKSFQRKDAGPTPPPDDPGNPTVNFHGETRKKRHACVDDRSGCAASIARGKARKRSWRISATSCSTTAMGWWRMCVPPRRPGPRSGRPRWCCWKPARRAKTVAGDKNYDVASFVADVRELAITPHVAQKANSAIDGRTTRHAGYAISQQKRKLVEQVFGWMKTVGGLRKLRHRGGELVDWIVTFTAAAYNLVRLRTLLAGA